MPNQNGSVYGLTFLSPILNDPHAVPSHDLQIRDYLATLPTGADSPFALAPGTHLARLVVMDDVIYVGMPACEEHLKSKYLVFETNCDGDLEPYFAASPGRPPHLDAIWSTASAIPAPPTAPSSSHYMKACQLTTTFFFAAVNNKTVPERCARCKPSGPSPTSSPRIRAWTPPSSSATSSTSPKLSPLPHLPPRRSMGPTATSRQGATMSKLNATDIQGFVLRGYNMPCARYCFLHFADAKSARHPRRPPPASHHHRPALGPGKPQSTVNIAFTFKGLAKLELPIATLISFPVEFQQGMKARGGILGDTGMNAPEHWDESGAKATSTPGSASTPSRPRRSKPATPSSARTRRSHRRRPTPRLAGRRLARHQRPAHHQGALRLHRRLRQPRLPRRLPQHPARPGQARCPTEKPGTPLATGELLLGYADEAGELPVAPVPHILAANGTFMVYRKLHQNVGTFRQLPRQLGRALRRRRRLRQRKARLQIHRPLARRHAHRNSPPTHPTSPSPRTPTAAPTSPTARTPAAPAAPSARTSAASIRATPSASDGRLINRRRITRRGLPYGPYAPDRRHR